MGGSEQADRSNCQGLLLCEGDDVVSRCCPSWTKKALPSSHVQLEVREERQSSRFQSN